MSGTKALQAAIDAGSAWRSSDSTESALALIQLGVCSLPPSIRALVEASDEDRASAAVANEARRWQQFIDSGDAFRRRHHGYFALALIDAGLCRNPPGVLRVVLDVEACAYRYVYTQEELAQTVGESIERLKRFAKIVAVHRRFEQLCAAEAAEMVAQSTDAELKRSLWSHLKEALHGAGPQGTAIRAQLSARWERACRDEGVDPVSLPYPAGG